MVIFAALATADAWSCPDGCQSCTSPGMADQCNNSGVCLFCAHGVASVTPPPSLIPFLTELPAPVLSPLFLPTIAVNVPDHPPRLT